MSHHWNESTGKSDSGGQEILGVLENLLFFHMLLYEFWAGTLGGLS